MEKQVIEAYFTKFQKEIVELKHELSAEKMRFHNSEQSLLIELFETIDAMENLLENLKQKEQDKTIKRVIKNIQSIQKKMFRILTERDIHKIEFPDNLAKFGFCKVVDTEINPELPEKTIVKTVKIGFQQKDKILRPAEVITIKN